MAGRPFKLHIPCLCFLPYRAYEPKRSFPFTPHYLLKQTAVCQILSVEQLGIVYIYLRQSYVSDLCL